MQIFESDLVDRASLPKLIFSVIIPIQTIKCGKEAKKQKLKPFFYYWQNNKKNRKMDQKKYCPRCKEKGIWTVIAQTISLDQWQNYGRNCMRCGETYCHNCVQPASCECNNLRAIICVKCYDKTDKFKNYCAQCANKKLCSICNTEATVKCYYCGKPTCGKHHRKLLDDGILGEDCKYRIICNTCDLGKCACGKIALFKRKILHHWDNCEEICQKRYCDGDGETPRSHTDQAVYCGKCIAHTEKCDVCSSTNFAVLECRLCRKMLCQKCCENHTH